MPTNRPDRQAELDAEAQVIIQAILERLKVLEESHGNGKSWLAKNWFSALSTLVLLATFGAAWGSLQANQVHIQQGIAEINTRITADEAIIRAHHDDQNRHTDAYWRNQITDALKRIEDKVDDHVAKK